MTTESPQPVEPRRSHRLVFGKNPRWTIVRVFVLVLVVFVVFKFILIPVRVTGVSMVPTFRDGHISMVNKLAYRSSKPKRGDIVVVAVTPPGEDHVKEHWLKRVIAVPGEKAEIREGELFINDQPLDEPYVKLKMPWRIRPVVLEQDQYIVLGDNRGMQAGQHAKGIFHSSEIIGKVIF